MYTIEGITSTPPFGTQQLDRETGNTATVLNLEHFALNLLSLLLVKYNVMPMIICIEVSCCC